MSFPRSGVRRSAAMLPVWQPPRRRRALTGLLAVRYGGLGLITVGWVGLVVFAALYDWGAL